jgi:predicted ATP-grasp superfamily ATP-dependent carboligase
MKAIKYQKKERIMVTGAGRGSAISIIRSLGRSDYRVIAADATTKSLGFRSRFAHEKVVYPSPEYYPQQFVEFLLEVVKRKQIDLIIPVTDLEIKPIINERALFEKITRIALPANELIEIFNDKVKTHQLAKKMGVPVPETFVVKNSTEALQLSNNLTWPVVVKPQYSMKLLSRNKIEKFGVTYAASPDELRRVMQKLEGKCAALLQAYHQGIGYGIELLTYNGRPIAVFSHKRLREIPITGGASSYRQSVKPDYKLYEYSLSLLKEIGWTGLAMVEFKVNESSAVLMEVNGRVWGSLPLAVASGVNFPLFLTELFLNDGGSIEQQLSNGYKIGLRCRNLSNDLMWITSVLMQRQKYPFLKIPTRTRAIKAFMGLFNLRHKFDLFSLDDPMPAFAEFPHILRKFNAKIRES